MRLTEEAVNAIQDVFLQVFEKGDLYLFGSTHKGGDIDLYLVPEQQNNLGEKRIDLVIHRGKNRPIDQIAMSEGMLICQRHSNQFLTRWMDCLTVVILTALLKQVM